MGVNHNEDLGTTINNHMSNITLYSYRSYKWEQIRILLVAVSIGYFVVMLINVALGNTSATYYTVCIVVFSVLLVLSLIATYKIQSYNSKTENELHSMFDSLRSAIPQNDEGTVIDVNSREV